MLGQKQSCLGGCFSADSSLTGDLANVRIWNATRSQVGPWLVALRAPLLLPLHHLLIFKL